MTDNELQQLEFIFYNEAPYDYVLEVQNRRRKYYLGSCSYDGKVCFLYGPEDYTSALITMLHEIAHARIETEYREARGHTEAWEMEFIFLLNKHNIDKQAIRNQVKMTSNMTRFVG